MEAQPDVYVNKITFTINGKEEVATKFWKFIQTFDIDLNPENDKEFELFNQEVLTPSLEIVSPSSLMLNFLTHGRPFDAEGFTLFPIHYDGILTMVFEYEATNYEDAGIMMWFGDKVISYGINKAYFILKKIDSLRLTEIPGSFKELSLMIDEPEKVIKYVMNKMKVSLEQLPYINFRPKINNNDFFKKME